MDSKIIFTSINCCVAYGGLVGCRARPLNFPQNSLQELYYTLLFAVILCVARVAKIHISA